MTRIERWNLSTKLDNCFVDELSSKKYRIYRYDCSSSWCRNRVGLRMTPSGIWCKEHYLSLPSCSEPDCSEPAVPDDWNKENQCRVHWLGELPDIDFIAVAHALYQVSPISLFENEERTHFERNDGTISFVDFRKQMNKWANENMPDESRRMKIEEERAYYSELKERRLNVCADAIDPL